MSRRSRATAHASPDPSGALGAATGGCTLLLAVRAAHRGPVCALLAGIAPGCRFAVATSLVDATLQLAQNRVDLLVLDLQLEPGPPLALIQPLARIAPTARILAFSDTASALPAQAYRVHGWPDAQGVLSAALAAHRGAEGPRTAEASRR